MHIIDDLRFIKDVCRLPLTCVSYSAIISLSFRNLAGDVISVWMIQVLLQQKTAEQKTLRLQISKDDQYAGMESSHYNGYRLLKSINLAALLVGDAFGFLERACPHTTPYACGKWIKKDEFHPTVHSHTISSIRRSAFKSFCFPLADRGQQIIRVRQQSLLSAEWRQGLGFKPLLASPSGFTASHYIEREDKMFTASNLKIGSFQ